MCALNGPSSLLFTALTGGPVTSEVPVNRKALRRAYHACSLAALPPDDRKARRLARASLKALGIGKGAFRSYPQASRVLGWFLRDSGGNHQHQLKTYPSITYVTPSA